MRMIVLAKVGICAALLVLVQLSPVYAQSRTWVSGVGDDLNPCSRTAPCKTFASAMSKTAAGGEISVLDPGGFGAVTINKSLSIVAADGEGSILANGGNAIIINAGANDVVSLHGLFIEGGGSGLNGVRFLAGGQLHLRHCLIRGFKSGSSGIGVSVETSNNSRTFISDCTIAHNNGGIRVKPSAANAVAFIERVQVDRNSGFGIQADGVNAVIRLDESTVVNNGAGLQRLNGGEIISFGTNVIAGNTPNGTPSSTVPLE